ncbi:UNVERIFIED_CONTAM: hypothetical protein Sradi_2024100, partial [Sesamum radiatum]
MEVRLIREHRFLIQFNHIIDRDRMLGGCPWSFDRNLIILNVIGEEDNPLAVDLQWCTFYIHVHNLPIRMMTREVAELIGNRIGKLLDFNSSQTL